MWCEDIQIIEVQRRYGINRKTIGLVYNKLGELASNYFDLDPNRLGGPGIICQVDESFSCHKQKFGKGRTPERERWVFGISDTSTKSAKFYMELVVNRFQKHYCLLFNEFVDLVLLFIVISGLLIGK
ncbi:hypothetical protein H311_01608 [Anncaliia algerae PRA109]|nr:hypothetical protein H311_01608 [Anncaliia algerae PRA109]